MSKRLSNIQKRRKLQDLFVRGVEVRFNQDGVNEGEPTEDDVVVFVTPPSPLQREMAVRDGQAAKARAVLAMKRDEGSDTATVSRAFVAEMDLNGLIEYLCAMSEGERQTEATRTILGKEEWADIDALRDSLREWEEAGYPEDDEWQLVLDRDKEYGDQVQAEMLVLLDAERDAYKLMPREVLEKKAMERRSEVHGTQEFMAAYQNSMLFFACRDADDHSVTFFETVQEMRSYPDEVQEALSLALATFISEVAEAKNSPRAGSGSDSVAPPVEPETSPASTLQESTA